jgi:glycosyltransferase involved in cell wall biosynthesis
MPSPDLVTVVIPAYNAASTLDETLRSVRAQTHRRLEIVVVDDGSTDATAEIVRRHVTSDSRIRLLKQANRGVADARNRGAKEGQANLLAFIDADDLWAPDKIEKQLRAFDDAPPSAALIYTWYARINASSCIVEASERPVFEGNVLGRLCRGNFVGNGSSIVVKRDAFEEVKGFDPGLRASKAQGCEDWLFYLRVAERYEFGVVPEVLTGYRKIPSNMSNDVMRMRRSWLSVASEMEQRHPELKREIAAGTLEFTARLLTLAMELRFLTGALTLAALLFVSHPLLAGRVVFGYLRASLRGRWQVATGPAATGRGEELARFPIGTRVS